MMIEIRQGDCWICRCLAEADKFLVGAKRAREANDLVAFAHLVACAHERTFVAKQMRHHGCAKCGGNVERVPVLKGQLGLGL